MVFGPGAEWQDLACHLALTPSTDNQTNAYILDRLMSTAFPASVILMELALQMQERQLELDLQGPLGSKTWRPMPDFTMLAEGKRIEVDLQNLDFKALHVLMGLAEEIDREIVLKRSQAAHQDLAKKLRLTQPWWPTEGSELTRTSQHPLWKRECGRGGVGGMRFLWRWICNVQWGMSATWRIHSLFRDHGPRVSRSHPPHPNRPWGSELTRTSQHPLWKRECGRGGVGGTRLSLFARKWRTANSDVSHGHQIMQQYVCVAKQSIKCIT